MTDADRRHAEFVKSWSPAAGAREFVPADEESEGDR